MEDVTVIHYGIQCSGVYSIQVMCNNKYSCTHWDFNAFNNK